MLPNLPLWGVDCVLGDVVLGVMIVLTARQRPYMVSCMRNGLLIPVSTTQPQIAVGVQRRTR